MQPRLFFLQNYYNMHKTLLGGGYLICNIKATIFVDCTMIADKKYQSREMKLWKPLKITFFGVTFHTSYRSNFTFSLFIFSSPRRTVIISSIIFDPLFRCMLLSLKSLSFSVYLSVYRTR